MKFTKTLTLVALASIIACAGFAAPQAETDLSVALEKAKKEKKLLFAQYGREKCGNCQALRGYIKGGQVRLSAEKYVYANLNCDDQATSEAFGKRFKVSGNMLPFVVVADADGKQLGARTGYGKAADFTKFIKDAESKAGK